MTEFANIRAVGFERALRHGLHKRWSEFHDYEVAFDEESDGFIAYCPGLNLQGWGTTKKEATDDLNALKKFCLEGWAKEGTPLPEVPQKGGD